MTSFPGPFDSPAHVHADACVSVAAESVNVQTATAQWAYAASYDLTGQLGDTSSTIHITARVTRGVVGIGCVHVSGEVFLDERLVSASDTPGTIDLVVHDPNAAGRLVFRNAEAGSASVIDIYDIRWEPIVTAADDDDARYPALTDPRPMVDWNRFYGATGDLPLHRLRAQKFTSLNQPITIQWTDGTRFRIHPGDQLSRAVYVSGTYEPNTMTVLKALSRTGAVFVDIGANAGLVSLAAAAWVGPSGTVLSFEPSSREFSRLLENLSLNNLSWVRPIRAAVADRTGQLALRVAPPAYGGLNTLGTGFGYNGVPTERIEEVEAITLDELARLESLDRIDILKIDVEGAEGAVLVGARHVLRHRRPAIVLEVFSRSLAASGWQRAQLAAELQSADYSLFAIDQSANLRPLATLDDIDEQNIVALPEERARDTVESVAAAGRTLPRVP